MAQQDTTAARDGRCRAVIEAVTPSIDGGRFPIKRIVGDRLRVEADVFTDGHDALVCLLRLQQTGDDWHEAPMVPLGNDRWRGELALTGPGRARYTVVAWVDRFVTWRRDLARRVEAGQDLRVDLAIGARLVRSAAQRALDAGAAGDASALRVSADQLADERLDTAARAALALDATLALHMAAYADRSLATEARPALEVIVDSPLARFSAWYELFPRSASPQPGRHGTLRDVEGHLPDLAGMGFDVLYLPPIHPIGLTHRKGRNNAPTAMPGDVGSPWAIGSKDGGHTAVHPELGTIEDLRHLVEVAREQFRIEIALDLAFQVSPDHPWVREHPQWFRHRPDGSIQYAENPPKKYEDIYPFDFECDDHRALWTALYEVVRFWCLQGVRVFRVDNPHTKPFALWEFIIERIKAEYPEALFLSEAFTRPRVMARLAKLGFSQSYTYFTWRNTGEELRSYLTELTRTELCEYFRPNFWPNTPDILPELLQIGGRPAFQLRVALAATLTASYGIYGPAFELMEAAPVHPGKEEYLDSEKYQLRRWDLARDDNLRPFIARLNAIRREHPALQQNATLAFHPTDNPQLLCFSKRAGDDAVLVVANLDPHHTQSGHVELDLATIGVTAGSAFQVHELIGEARYLWSGSRNFVELDPHVMPVHIFAVRRRVRTEHDFDYYL